MADTSTLPARPDVVFDPDRNLCHVTCWCTGWRVSLCGIEGDGEAPDCNGRCGKPHCLVCDDVLATKRCPRCGGKWR